MSGWAKSLGRCAVCGEPVSSHEEALAFLFPRRMLVHVSICVTKSDQRLEQALAKVLDQPPAGRHPESAHSGTAPPAVDHPLSGAA